MKNSNKRDVFEDNPQVEIEGEASDGRGLLATILNSKKFKDTYSKLANSPLEAFPFFEEDVIDNVDYLTRKIQTWDIETVKNVPADELEQTFLSLYDNLYVLIQNVNPFWQVGMERINLLKDYQDLYVEMLKVRGEL